MSRRGTTFTWAYGAYGVVLALCGLLLSGAGEGPMLAFALFGSPLTLVPFIPWHPLVWGVVGRLVASRYKLAVVLLAAHYLVAPAAMYMNLKFGSSFDQEFAIAQRQTAEAPIFAVVLMLPYIAGQVITWWLLWTVHRQTVAESQT